MAFCAGGQDVQVHSKFKTARPTGREHVVRLNAATWGVSSPLFLKPRPISGHVHAQCCRLSAGSVSPAVPWERRPPAVGYTLVRKLFQANL